MRNKHKLWCFLGVGVMSLASGHATTLTVNYAPDLKDQYPLEDVRSVVLLSEGESNERTLELNLKDGNQTVYTSTKKARSIVLSEQSAAPITEAGCTYQIFPNPATEEVTISGVEQGTTITLLNTGGTQLNKIIASGASVTLPVSVYPNGTYILVVGQHTFKILKSN